MGDADKPFGNNNLHPFISFGSSDLSKSSSETPYVSHEVEEAILRLQDMSEQAAKNGDKLSRRFFWHYLRRELEDLLENSS